MTIMKRRRVLQSLAFLPSLSALSAADQPMGQKTGPPVVDERPTLETAATDSAAETIRRYFTDEQFLALQRLSDIIAPSLSGIPGALAAGTPEFLDFLISQSPADTQRLYRDGLDALNQKAQLSFGTGFSRTASAQADELLAPLRAPWSYEAPPEPLAAFLVLAKDQILKATVHSREWIKVVSKRDRGASGIGTYWHVID